MLKSESHSSVDTLVAADVTSLWTGGRFSQRRDAIRSRPRKEFTMGAGPEHEETLRPSHPGAERN